MSHDLLGSDCDDAKQSTPLEKSKSRVVPKGEFPKLYIAFFLSKLMISLKQSVTVTRIQSEDDR